MDLRRLFIFLAVVDEGSFTRAADSLDCSQPAVSQAIRDLEAELETRLFHRIGRSVEITPAGAALLTGARQLRRDHEVCRAAVRAVTNLDGGQLDIACLPTLAVAPLSPLVSAFRERYPGIVAVIAAPEDTEELLDCVRSGRSEIGIVQQVSALIPELSVVDLGTQDFLVVLPPGSRHRRTKVPLDEIVAMPIIVPPRGTSTRQLIDEAYSAIGATMTIGVETSHRQALIPLIIGGAGIAILARQQAELARSLGCVVVEPLPAIRRAVALVHRRSPLTPAAEAFVMLAMERPLFTPQTS